MQIVKSAYLDDKSSDVDEIWCTNADFELDDSHVTKLKKFKIQGGRQLPF